MNKKENNLKIIYSGRYSVNEILSGPELTARRIFEQHCLREPSVFIQYFFDGRKFGLMKKLFGRDEELHERGRVLTLGIFRIIPELRKLKPDIIHLVTFERFAVIFYLYSLIFKVQIVFNSHGVIQYENKVLKDTPMLYSLKDKFCERIFIKHSDKIVFPSVNTLNIAGKYYIFEEETAVILPNGIDDVFFSEKKITGTSNRPMAVIHHRNELNNSGMKLLFDTLTTADLPIDVYVVTNSLHKLPENNKINFINVNPMMTSELAEFYRDKDIFLSLNGYDTFSISTAEAMASGLIPVITTETGVSRYIENGVNGFTFDHHFKHDLVKILSDIFNMPADKRALISISAQDIVKYLTWHSVYEMYVPIYNGIAE
ncbi:MAG: glycosyltransferase family 4 protein [Ignavibacteria bacterium]